MDQEEDYKKTFRQAGLSNSGFSHASNTLIRIFFILILFSSFFINLQFLAQGPGYPIDPESKFAWSANAGWVNHLTDLGSVVAYDSHLEGHAWSESIGWIRMGTHTGGGNHHYENTSNSNYGVNNTGGSLSGFAWSANAGWISFDPEYGGVSIDLITGDFSGFAWSESIGWISFSGIAADYTPYMVRTLYPVLYEVTIFVEPSDIGISVYGAGQYSTGTEVTISVGSVEGFGFDQWTGAHSGLLDDPSQMEQLFVMPDHDVVFTAVFEPLPPVEVNVAIFVDPVEMTEEADPSGAGIYMSGSEVTISANHIDEYVFMGWEGSTYLLDDPSKLSQTFTMPWYDVEFTAVYAILQPSAIISIEQFPLKGIWEWRYSAGLTTWRPLMKDITANKIKAGDITGDGIMEVIMDIEVSGLGFFCLTNNAWNYLAETPVDFTLVKTAEGHYKILGSFADGIREYDFMSKSWSHITPHTARIIHAVDFTGDGDHELAIAFDAVDGLYIYSFVTGSLTRRTLAKVKQLNSGDITGDGHEELVVVFDQFGIYMLKQAPDDKQFADVTNVDTAEISISKDIRKSGKWYSDSKGLTIYRIAMVMPMEGHIMATADMAYDNGQELIFSWNNRLIKYSYSTGGFDTIVLSPMKRVISGRFTGHSKDDLIVCDSITGSIFLYKTATKTFILMENQGDSNAMATMK